MKLYISTIIIAGLILMPACSVFDPENHQPAQVELNKKTAEIIEADQQFAFEIFSEVYDTTEEDNFMISPLSVSYALGMTYNGSAGSTRDAFVDVLHFDELTETEVNESYQDLMHQLVHLDKQVEFSIANSIWYKLGYNVLESFINTNQTYFDAAVEELEFSDPGAVDIINGWIEDKTNDKIQDMLDFIPANAVMYLINAIYFNAEWTYQFDPEDTYEGDFTLGDGTLHKTDFMKIEQTFPYAVTEDFRAVELPYGDSTFSMLIFMPVGDMKLNELIAKMDKNTLNTWAEYAHPQEMIVEIPRFKDDFKMLLNGPLIDLGLGVAFGELADFSNITPGGGLYISRVIHQTYIDVMEEGTEAAAATIVELRENAVQYEYFRANQPFVYLIKENSTDAVMFMGKVGKPEYPDD